MPFLEQHKNPIPRRNAKSLFFYAGIFGLGANLDLNKLASTAKGLNPSTLFNTVNWYFSLDNLSAANQMVTGMMEKLWLPNEFKKEQNFLHTSSDAQKHCVSAESLNANYSYKYYGNGQGANVYRFIDERGILFYTSVFSSSERDAAYVIDGLLHNNSVDSDMHSTDTHGYTEVIFGLSHLIGITFAPRIKDIASQKLVSFDRIKPQLEKKGYAIQPAYYVKENKIKNKWDMILRFIVTLKLREHKASTIIKRLGAYEKQHPLQEGLKAFGQIIKSIFILKYIDDVELRQTIEKQLNKGELANKFASAISISNDDILEPLKDDQEIAAMCKTFIQNVIVLWNYVELTKIIMRSEEPDREALLSNITNGSILSWQHVNLLGTYDFRYLKSANDSDFTRQEVIGFTAN